MKSLHQIASELVDAWPGSVNVKSSDKVVLVTMIAEALLKPRIFFSRSAYEAAMKEETK